MNTISKKNLLIIQILFLICLVFCTASADSPKRVLFINSYEYDFETVPIVMEELSKALNGKAAIQYLFMNEKYVDDDFASAQLEQNLEYLTQKYHYDAVILGDDAAFDFSIKNRERFFAGIPLIFENVNSPDKAKEYDSDSYISGVVELFPMKETIAVARKIMTKAKRVVVITDNSISGSGSAKQAMNEQKDFPDLKFEMMDCSKLTPDGIQKAAASYKDDTILLYTVFNVDAEGNRYSLPQGVKLITDAAGIPVFKADEAGMGYGLAGGYVLSYSSIGQQTAQLVLKRLENPVKPSGESYLTGNCVYMFDADVLKRYGIEKRRLPKNSIYINDEPGFFELHGKVILVSTALAILIITGILCISLRKRREMQMEIMWKNEAIRTEEAANQAKTEFLSRMSHDIRTPLNVILGMNKLAEEHIENPEEAKGYLRKAYSSGELLQSLVNDVLDMSKIESGKIHLEKLPYKMADLFENLRSIFQPLCEQGKIGLTFSDDAPETIISTDKVRLNQIFCNILSNSVKFTPENGKISFELESHADGGQLICRFILTDTGCGMSEEFQKKMFQPFSQEERNLGINRQGTGLGLSIVKSITDLMGGEISVSSRPNEGTTFLIDLVFPIVAQQTEAGIRTEETENFKKNLSGKRILLVEDNALNAEITQAFLENAGITVEFAENGKIASEMFRASKAGYYDAILMDNRMPVMGGLEATRLIRTMDHRQAKTIPIIALTADAFDDEIKQFLEAGMNAYLTKPVDSEKLYRILSQQLS